MNPLATFTRRLRWLGRSRLLGRVTVSASNLLVICLLSLAVLFAVDYVFRLSAGPRTVSAIMLLTLVAWLATREAVRLWQTQETLVDLALLLERRHQLDTDLVAALQFCSPTPKAAGSSQLAAAVVEHAAQLAERLEYGRAVPTRQTWQQVRWGVAALLVMSVIIAAYPEPAFIFARRLLWGGVEYPTRTRIESVEICGQQCTDGQGVTLAERSPLSFSILCSGIAPTDVTLRLETWNSDESLQLPLRREGTGSLVYRADGPTLSESLKFRLQMGDAPTFTGLLTPLLRPLVEVTTEIVPPEYARGVLDTEYHDERQCRALMGSTVGFDVRCVNGKCLQAATLSLTTKDGSISFPLVEEEGAVWRWRPDPSQSRWAQLNDEISYNLDVEDADGLHLEQPLVGHITPQIDQPPRVTVSTLHTLVTAQAKPVIRYAADDDFGLTRLLLHVRWEGKSVANDSSTESSRTFVLRLAESPTRAADLPVTAEFELPLSELALAPGDRLIVSCEAVDARGTASGIATLSEPITFNVADEQAVLQTILGPDAEAERILNSAIDNELGLGRRE